jgi:hypothetical protein
LREREATRSGASLPRATLPELVRRTLVAAGPARNEPSDLLWVREVLTPVEHDLWKRQSPFDQDHVVQVARRVQRRLAATVHADDPRWVGAALMHDVGKSQTRLTWFERAVAALAGRRVRLETARRWARTAGLKARIGAYLTHGEIGARMIRAAGGRSEIAAWAEIHQHPHAAVGLGIPADVVDALLESDVA